MAEVFLQGSLTIHAVIFDLDGLLADTERLHMAAYQIVLARHHVPLSDTTYEKHWILEGKGIAAFAKEYDYALDLDEIRLEKATCYEHLVRTSVKPMPGAIELLKTLESLYPLALATSSYRDSAACVIDSLHIRAYFRVVVANQDVPRIKPAPDLFLLAAARLGIAPDECIAVEDSEKGVRAAFAAGIPCIAVPNSHTANHNFATALAVLPSLANITPELLFSFTEH